MLGVAVVLFFCKLVVLDASQFRPCLHHHGEFITGLGKGLGTTVSCLNGLYVRGIKYNIPVVPPVVKPGGHDLNHTFADFLVDWNAEDELRTFPSIFLYMMYKDYKHLEPWYLDPAAAKPSKVSDTLELSRWQEAEFQRYALEKVHRLPLEAAQYQLAKQLNCTHLLALRVYDVTGKSFDYSLSRLTLRQLYFRHGHQPADYITAWRARQTKPVLVLLHHRLGDVATISSEKRLYPNWPVVAMQRLAQVLKPSCVQLVMVSDAASEDPELLLMLDYFQNQGFTAQSTRSLVGFNGHAQAKVDFELMVHADVLVVGPSGFSRLAAVLRNRTVLATPLKSHPLSFPHVVHLPWEPSASFAEEQVYAQICSKAEFEQYASLEIDKYETRTAARLIKGAMRKLRDQIENSLADHKLDGCFV